MTTSIRSGANDSSLQVNGVDSLNFNSGGAERKLESVTCTQSGGALTFTLNPTVMSMRSTTLNDGTVTTVKVNSAVTLTLPSGGTLGFPTTVQGRIYAVLMSNGELAIISAAGGNDLSETGVISTTAIGASSTANNVFYSTTARTGLAYRVVGAIDVVNTAGAWGNPVLVQGAGGEALTAMSSAGMGQTWQNMTGSRAVNTAVTNTTAKPIQAIITLTSSATYNFLLSLGASQYTLGSGAAGLPMTVTVNIPVGLSYSATLSAGTVTLVSWLELR